MGKPEYEMWYEDNEAELQDAYVEYLTERGELLDYVFFWDRSGDRLIDWKMKAERLWDDFVQASYDEACSRLPEREEYENR